jgi:hypothetical protein
VILGPGDGDFFASDCNGTVERKPAEPRVIPRLERASTLRSFDGPISSRRASSLADNGEPIDYSARRRSATLSSLGRYPNRRASLFVSYPPHVEPQQEIKPRQVVPLASAREPDQPSNVRRQSVMITSAPRRSNTEPRRNPRRSQSPPDRTTIESGVADLSEIPALEAVKSGPLPPPTRKTISTYVDASVQTDTIPSPSPPEHHIDQGYYRGHIRDWSSVSSISTAPTSYSSSGASSRRSSIRVDNPAKPSLLDQQAFANPVMMGRMQDYFRSSSYRLGDSMSFAPLGCSP